LGRHQEVGSEVGLVIEEEEGVASGVGLAIAATVEVVVGSEDAVGLGVVIGVDLVVTVAAIVGMVIEAAVTVVDSAAVIVAMVVWMVVKEGGVVGMGVEVVIGEDTEATVVGLVDLAEAGTATRWAYFLEDRLVPTHNDDVSRAQVGTAVAVNLVAEAEGTALAGKLKRSRW
jgi:hypothetical protein